MEKVINFEDAANKTRKNKQSGAEKADFPNFAEWYAEYILDHKSDFIRLVMPYVRDTAESACQLAALNFKNFYLIPESLLCFLNLVEQGASLQSLAQLIHGRQNQAQHIRSRLQQPFLITRMMM